MKRHLVVVVLWALVLGASGCGAWNDIFGGKSQGVIVGPGQLEEGCSTPRPSGSACDANHLCAVGQYCDCTGNCKAAQPSNQGDDPVVCVKAAALVQPLLSDVACSASVTCPTGLECSANKCVRRCEWNDQCAWGSYCERSSGYCKADCLEGVKACTGMGETCGCDGHCKAADKITARKFDLLTDPGSLTIPENSVDWSRTIQVGLKTKDETLLTGTGETRTADATIDLAAGANLTLDCDAGDSVVQSADKCSLSGVWSFRYQGDSWLAFKTIAVKGVSAIQASGAEGWSIRAASKEAGWQPTFIRVDPVAALGDATWSTLLLDGQPQAGVTGPVVGQRYTGTVRVRSEIDRATSPQILVPSANGFPVEAVVEACGQGGMCLSFHDSAGLLSASRVFSLPMNGTTTSTFWRQNLSDLLRDLPGGKATTAGSKLTTLKLQSTTKALWGTAQAAVRWGPDGGSKMDTFMQALAEDISFTLTPETRICGDVEKCEAGKICAQGQCVECVSEGDCSSGQRCHAGFCELTSTEQANRSSTFLPNALSDAGGVSRDGQTPYPHRLASFLAPDMYSSIEGLFMDGGIDSVPAYALPEAVVSHWTGASGSSIPPVKRFQSYLLSFESNGPVDTDVRDANGTLLCENECLTDFVSGRETMPCVEPLAAGEAWPAGATIGATCDVLFDRIQRTNPDDPAADFQSFCQPLPLTIRARNYNTGQQILKKLWTCKDWPRPYAFGDRTSARRRSRTHAERVLCLADQILTDQSPSDPALGKSGILSESLASSGDLECRSGSTSSFKAAFPFIFAKEVGSQAASDRAALLRDCLNDLDSGPARYPQTKACVKKLKILELADISARQPEKHFQLRLAQQWFELASFVGAGAFEELRLQDTDAAKSSLPAASPANTPTPPKQIDRDRTMHVLANALATGMVMLGSSLDATLDANTAMDPDYREPAADDAHEQPYGPAPVMLEAATNYLRLVALYLEQEQLSTYAEAVEGKSPPALAAANAYAAEAIKAAEMVAWQSTIIYQKVSSIRPCTTENQAAICPNACITDASGSGRCKEAVWVERWRKDRDAYLEMRTLLSEKATTRRNPLGIDEDDLPLFFGDLQGTNSRFFAASDYLMNTWATSAVASAQGALSVARDAWVAERDKSVANEDRQNEHDRLIASIQKQYAAPIIDACGLPPQISELTVLGRYGRSGIPDDCHINRDFVKTLEDGTTTKPCSEPSLTPEAGALDKAAVLKACIDSKRASYIYDEMRAAGLDKASRTVRRATPSGSNTPTAQTLPYQCVDYFIRNPPTKADDPEAKIRIGTGGPFFEGVSQTFFPNSRPCEVDESFYKNGTLATCNTETEYSYYPLSPMAPNPGTAGAYGFIRPAAPLVRSNGFNYSSWYVYPDGQGGNVKFGGFIWGAQGATFSDAPVSDFLLQHAFAKIGTDLYFSPLSWGKDDPLSPASQIKNNQQGFGDVLKVWVPESLLVLDGAGPSVVKQSYREAVTEVSCSPKLFFLVREAFEQQLTKNAPLPGDISLKAKCEEETKVAQTDFISTPALSQECYRGELGKSYLDGIGAKQDVELAKKRWGSEQEVYRIRTKGCLITAEAGAEEADALAKFNSEMTSLNDVHTGLSVISSAISFASGNATSWLGGQTALIERSMDLAQRHHAEVLTAIQNKKELLKCLNELEAQRAVFVVQKAEIVRRATDAIKAFVAYNDTRLGAERALKDGLRAIEIESGRGVRPLNAGYWYEEKSERYLREFKWAKRLTFLVLRAVEYEFQQSFPLRSEILTAKHPDALEAALRSMQSEVATRAVNRRRPEEQSVVLSVRDDILGIRDKTESPVGERLMSSAQILSGRLWDPRYAVYGADGKWVGQGIPFNFKPYGTLENRCAERVWRINATIQGDGLSDKAPGAPVMILKRNTFNSQWCQGHGDGSDFQVGRVQPSRNLFLDVQKSGESSESNAFGVASVFPWFNVRRAEFFKDQFVDGSSEELAGRGLYGDYLLLFPRQLLTGAVFPNPSAQTLGDLPPSRFPLERVEDVLLRFDYISVDDFQGLGPTFATAPNSSKLGSR